MVDSRTSRVGIGEAEGPSGSRSAGEGAQRSSDGAVRTAAVWALERVGDARAVPGLVEALTDGMVREDVARVLKKIGDVRAVEALIDGLMGNNWMVRRHAAEALGQDRRCRVVWSR